MTGYLKLQDFDILTPKVWLGFNFLISPRSKNIKSNIKVMRTEVMIINLRSCWLSNEFKLSAPEGL